MAAPRPEPRSVGRIGVVGLGYVGLPLAAAFAEAGFSVVGVDNDPGKIAALASGASYVEGVGADRLRPFINAGSARFTEDHAALGEAEAVIVCLPTPLTKNKEPDLSALLSGIRAVARNLEPGALVVLESSTYPGSTREVVLPILEEGGRRVGEDFNLAYSPERIDPGNETYNLKNTPKLVGGITAECTVRARELYARIVEEVFEVSSPEVAEMTKLLENVFRSVNIALVNELAIICRRMDIDVWKVVEAAATKPFGFMSFSPGPGLGGHCIPVDPFYLSWRARAFDSVAAFVELAGRVNVGMPHYATNRITSALNAEKKPLNGSRVLMLGISYKPNIGDIRESPSLKIMELLVKSGAEVVYHDPHVPHLPQHGLSSVELTKQELWRSDCVVIATDHDAVDVRLVVDVAPKVVDLRNVVRGRLGELPDNVEVL